jgi:ketosteroid isomerase-like protein
MKTRFLFLLATVLIFGLLVSRGQDAKDADAERYIVDSERQWAEAVASGDTAVVERILADDYLGMDPDGGLYDKSTAISFTREGPKDFVSNHLNSVKVRFFGDTAIAQGSESWVRRSGTPLRGRFAWTDTWIRRNGKWQIVASEDLIAPEKVK